MELIHTEPQWTHGGSLRYFVAPCGQRPVEASVARMLDEEKALGLHQAETYRTFQKNCEHSRDKLKQLLVDLKKKKKRVMGYGATSKSATVLNYCGITPDLVESICDSTPAKQGRVTPGAHIPIVSPETFRQNKPDYALLFAWNHEVEIREKERDFTARGGKWILYVPYVGIVA